MKRQRHQDRIDAINARAREQARPRRPMVAEAWALGGLIAVAAGICAAVVLAIS